MFISIIVPMRLRVKNRLLESVSINISPSFLPSSLFCNSPLNRSNTSYPCTASFVKKTIYGLSTMTLPCLFGSLRLSIALDVHPHLRCKSTHIHEAIHSVPSLKMRKKEDSNTYLGVFFGGHLVNQILKNSYWFSLPCILKKSSKHLVVQGLVY